MLTSKSKYALKALVYLARHTGRPVLGAEIAERQAIPKKFLDAILLQLKNDGVLSSRKGKGGGYKFALPPQALTVGRIIRLLDGPVAGLPCASQTAYRRCEDCADEASCSVRRVMLDVRAAAVAILDTTSIEDMRQSVAPVISYDI